MADIPPGKSEVEARAAAWPARTWSPAELVTAGMMNGVRDQLNELHEMLGGGGGTLPDAILSDNVAMKNESNIFTTTQQIKQAGGIAEFDLEDLSTAVQLRLINYTSKFMVYYNPAGALFTVGLDGTVTLPLANNLATARLILGGGASLRVEAADLLGVVSADNARWAGVQASHFYSVNSGNNLADLTLRGATNFQGGVTVSAGGAAITGSTVVNQLTVNSSGLAVTGGVCDIQSGTLYSRQGLRQGLDPANGTGTYNWFEESSNHIRAAGGLYDFARGNPIGNWVDFTPAVAAGTAGSGSVSGVYASRYCLVGHMLIIIVYIGVNLTNDNGFFFYYLPVGSVAGYSASPLLISERHDITGMMQSSGVGETFLRFYHGNDGYHYVAAGSHIYNGVAIVPIQ